MILSKRVALDGVYLDELHDSIVIRGFDPGVPSETIQAANMMGGSGQRITGQHWETLEASVAFAIDISKRDMALRREVYDAVMTWASRKGWLTVDWLTGRRMYVDKVVFPSSGDMWAWTDEYTIGFRAYSVPFWQDSEPSIASNAAPSASGQLSLHIGGNVESVVDAAFENRSGAVINSFQLAVNGNLLTIQSMGLAANETLTISHGTNGILRIMAGNRSLYDRYTGADDLRVMPGTASVLFSAERAGILTVSSCGRWI